MLLSIFNPARKPNSQLIALSILFLLSGAASLIYEIVWERLLELYFGVTMMSITLIVASYMSGLGLGSLLGGRIAQSLKQPVLAYGIVEACIGLFGIFSPSLIVWVGQRTAGSPYGLVFLLSFALLLIPTLLMGMTLPLLTQSFVERVETSGQVIGLLYGINTLGAALGALVSGYILIGWLGLNGSIIIAVILNLLVGVGAIFLIKKLQLTGESVSQMPKIQRMQKPETAKSGAWSYQVILSAAFLVGFIDLGFEILWFRVLGILNKTTAYSFPSILFVFLLGLAVGGIIWGRKADESRDPVGLFWKLQLSVGIMTTLSLFILWGTLHLPFIQDWLRVTFGEFQQPISPFLWDDGEVFFSRRAMLAGLLQYFIPIILLVFPASLLMGGGLPVLDRIAIKSAELAGRRVGDIHLANILGSTAGSLAVSFLFLPAIGSELTFKLLALLSLIFAVFAWRTHHASLANLIKPMVGLLVIVLILPWRGGLFRDLYKISTGKEAIIYESGESVLALSFAGNDSPTMLWINGIENSYFPTDGRYERSALTCAGASHPKRILIIGLGGGNTAYFMTQLPDVDEIVIVELMKDLGSFLNERVEVTQRVFSDSRVRYIPDDGRRFLYANPNEKYDMVFIDPLFSFTAGHNNLYSREAMQLYQTHLTENGVFCGWINEENVLPKTVASVFPYTDHFREVVVAGNKPLEYDREYIQDVYEIYLDNSKGIYSIAASGTLAPEKILGRYVSDKAGILFNETNTPILTDMNAWLEYYYFHKPLSK